MHRDTAFRAELKDRFGNQFVSVVHPQARWRVSKVARHSVMHDYSAAVASLRRRKRYAMRKRKHSSFTRSMWRNNSGLEGSGLTTSAASVCPGGVGDSVDVCGARCVLPTAHPEQLIGGRPNCKRDRSLTPPVVLP
eukprot:IDg6111t1